MHLENNLIRLASICLAVFLCRPSFAVERVGIAAIDLRDESLVKAENENVPLPPASVQKVLVSALALETLGPEFRFETDVLGELKGSSVPELVIRGGSAPDLTTEELWKVVLELEKKGVRRIGRVLLDDSQQVNPKERTGPQAYEAASGALSLNFNSLQFLVCPGTGKKNALIRIDPVESDASLSGSILTVPGDSEAFEIEAADIPPRSKPAFTARGEIGASQACKDFYRSVQDPLTYFGSVLNGLLKERVIRVETRIERGGSGSRLPVLYAHRSRPLRLLVDDMNHFSTNFIAEQLLAASGKDSTGKMDRLRGIEHLSNYVRQLGFREAESFSFVDGSGLSHENRATPYLIVKVLSRMYLNPQVREEFVSSLSVAERSGTLRERSFGISPLVLRAKTGTLDGVTALAGFVTSKSGIPFAFAILQDGKASREDALHAERDLVQAIADR